MRTQLLQHRPGKRGEGGGMALEGALHLFKEKEEGKKDAKKESKIHRVSRSQPPEPIDVHV